MGELGLILILSLHLICVNVSAGAPLVCVWLEWREGKGDRVAGQAGRYLAFAAVWLFLLGILLGLGLGYLLWSDHYRNVLMQIRSRVVFGIWEIAFSLVLMAAHAFWWKAAPTCSRKVRMVRSLLPLMAGTNLLYHFPGLFAIISKLSYPSAGVEPIGSADFRGLMFSSEVMARSVHFWLASLAVTGVVL
ncbi:MAG: hypothetical protein IH991_23915, partial [Planctomycetes bacterium]|nr:hypothetical protein [Planctomycetota bacterium]